MKMETIVTDKELTDAVLAGPAPRELASIVHQQFKEMMSGSPGSHPVGTSDLDVITYNFEVSFSTEYADGMLRRTVKVIDGSNGNVSQYYMKDSGEVVELTGEVHLKKATMINGKRREWMLVSDSSNVDAHHNGVDGYGALLQSSRNKEVVQYGT
jgi:hypothetical protein